MKKICNVMIGLPGLGKSTIVSDFYLSKIFIYSTDNVIENVAKEKGLTYSDVFTDTIDYATKVCDEGLERAIKVGNDLLFDQTNLGAKKRKKIVNKVKPHGYTVWFHVILPPSPTHIDDQVEWKRRLDNRPGKVIPDHVMKAMKENFVIPTEEEGYDEIYFYNMYGQWV